MVQLGDEVKCKVTGFKGIAIGLTDYLNGCRRVGIQPRVDKDGKLIEPNWFDEPQLEVIKKRKVEMGSRDKGGPAPSTPRRAPNPS